MGIIAWIVIGLIAGAVAKLIMPGPDPGGILLTIVIGIVGALLGGFIGSALGWGSVAGFDLRSLLLAIGGALLLLVIWRAMRGRGRRRAY